MNMPSDSKTTTDIRPQVPAHILRAGLDALRAHADKTALLDGALADLAEQGDATLRQSVARLRQGLAAFEPSVTLLGQVKSGKTTLVNAMAGWADLLPSDVNPWTSVVTSLHLSPRMTDGASRAAFRFFGADEWDRLMAKGGKLGELADRAGAAGELQKIREQIEAMREKSRQRLGRKFELLLGQTHDYGYFDKNLVERYICLGDMYDQDGGGDQGRFADITKSADLFLPAPAMPVALCLRDTPGVNDTFMMREQVTIQAIRDSRLCVVVLSAHQALSSIDMGVIRLISNLAARDVVIFVNRIDELADPAAQIPEIRDSIRQTLKAQDGPEDAEIIFGSAYWAGKVLSNQIEAMSDASAEALLNWAAVSMTEDADDSDTARMVWDLSGLPALFAALSARIVAGPGHDILTRTAREAMNLATGLKVSQAITVAAQGEIATMPDPAELAVELDRLAHTHSEALRADLERIAEGHRTRSDRAHGNFLDRATHSLIRHLEAFGQTPDWSYDPMGLRMLLRSAYNVFATQTRSAAQKRYDAAAADIAALYARSFGAVVDGITIAAPQAPEAEPPVTIGQTIALDFKDSWWSSWWKRTRGYKAFAESFRAMIKAETDGILAELTRNHAGALHAESRARLTAFMADQRKAILALAETARDGAQALEQAIGAAGGAERSRTLDKTLETPSRWAA
ncbi:MAG: hypothetical protein EP307_09885 [Rhodobacteraceae bacterium]|nr:MAG: hypothetical protein EP307_09885 [Paracoccaceae bacterium]